MPNAPDPSLQTTREQCRVGDFVAAEDVPEWRDETAPQEFRPQTYDLSPMISGFGGTVRAVEQETWRFERSDTRFQWVRVS